MNLAALSLVVLAIIGPVAPVSVEQPPGNRDPARSEQQAEYERQDDRLALNQEISSGKSEAKACDLAPGGEHASETWTRTDYLTYYLDWLTGALVALGALAFFLTIKLERPWLIPHVSDENTNAVEQMFKTRIRFDDATAMSIPSLHVAVSNHGRVPGWIHEQCITLRRMPIDPPPDPPYDDPPHSIIEQHPPVPIPHDGQLVQQRSRVLFFSSEALESIEKGTHCLVFYGYFKYRGIFRRVGWQRETRFCWMTIRKQLDVPSNTPPRVMIRFEPGGPANWTRYT